MAQINNPRKQFQFGIIFADFGLDEFLVQKVTLPDQEAEVVEHGDINYDVKTPGRLKYSNLMLESIMTQNSQGLYGDANVFQNWFEACQSFIGQGGQPSSLYKRTISVVEYGLDGTTILNTWTYIGCWPCKITGLSLDRMGSENTNNSVEICVDGIIKV